MRKLLLIILIPLLCGWTYFFDFENLDTNGDDSCWSIDYDNNYGTVRAAGRQDTEHVKSGSYSYKIDFLDNSTGGGGGYVIPQNIPVVDGVSEYWCSMWCYFGDATDNTSGEDWSPAQDGTTGVWKFMRVAKYDVDNVPHGWNSIYGRTDGSFRGDLEESFDEGSDPWNTYNVDQSEPKTIPSSGEWHQYEMYVKFGTTDELGHLTIWIDREPIIDIDIATMADYITQYGGYNLLFTYWNDTPIQDQSCWVDDYYISTTQRCPVFGESISDNTIVTLQQGLNGYSGCEDSAIKQGSATTNFSTATTYAIYYSVGALEKILIKFDLSSIPSNATITKAWLDTYCTNASSTAHTVKVNRVLKPVVFSELTYNVYSTGNSWDSAGCQAATDYDSDITKSLVLTAANTYTSYFSTVLTDDVQKMVNGTYENNGWVIMPTSEPDASYRSYASSENVSEELRPKLVIEYTTQAQTQKSKIIPTKLILNTRSTL